MKRIALLSAVMAGGTVVLGAETPRTLRLYLDGLLEERAGRFSRAESIYGEVAELDPAALSVRESLVDMALLRRDLPAARRWAEELVHRATASSDARLLLGKVLDISGSAEEARKALDTAVRLSPNDPDVVAAAAERARSRDPRVAAAYYRNYLERNPGDADVRARYARLQLEMGEAAGAEKNWKALIEQDPLDASARVALAQIYEVQNATAAALAAYQAAVEVDPGNRDLAAHLGELYARSGRIQEARSVLMRLNGLEGDNAQALSIWKAVLAEALGDLDQAAAHMAEAARYGETPNVLARWAYYLTRSGRHREALKVLKRLWKQNPEDPDALLSLAEGYENLRRHRPAAMWFRRVVDMDPGRAGAWFSLGAHLDALGRKKEAEGAFAKGLALDGTWPPALNWMGYTWAEEGRNLPVALEYTRRAVKARPENGSYRDSLGWVCFKLGLFAEAEPHFVQAIALEDDPVLWDHYGRTLDALGKHDEALRAYYRGLLSDPRNKGLLAHVKGRPLPAPPPPRGVRELLHRAREEFRSVRTLVSSFSVEGASVSVQGTLFYARPDRLRVEIPGPLGMAEFWLVKNSTGTWVQAPAKSPLPRAGVEAWAGRMTALLSGEFFGTFDAPVPMVESTHEALTVTVSSQAVTMASRTGRVVRVDFGGGVGCVFEDPAPGRDFARVWRWTLPEGGFVFRLRRPVVNRPLKDSLFDRPQ
jgi:tetratricopeptide (TPR) repeat protein